MDKYAESSFERIAERLIWLRKHYQMTQKQFAKNIDVGPTQYNNWEKARQRLSLEGALKIHSKYGISLDFLFLNRTDMLPHHLVKSLSGSSAETSTSKSSDNSVSTANSKRKSNRS